jgi:predicted amidohydrolase
VDGRSANLRHFDRQLEGVSGRDLIVLPEMFTTGFAMEAAKQSLPQEEVIDWMLAKALQTNALIAGALRCKPSAARLTASRW